jgi:hypothetical protein
MRGAGRDEQQHRVLLRPLDPTVHPRLWSGEVTGDALVEGVVIPAQVGVGTSLFREEPRLVILPRWCQ